jgi:serine/threonine protein kinase
MNANGILRYSLQIILNWQNMYDKQLSTEFRSEIETLSKIGHSNLVRLLGYLEHEDERLIMVEYVNNGSLREHLDGRYCFFHS